MTIHYLTLALAILLLWLPRQWLRLGNGKSHNSNRDDSRAPMRSRSSRETRSLLNGNQANRSIRLGVELKKVRNYLDLARGYAGGLALSSFSFTTLPENGGGSREILMVMGLIILVGILLQSTRFDGEFTLFAPIFYLGGLSLGICDLEVALFAFVLIWAIGFVLPTPEAFLVVHAFMLAGFAFALTQLDVQTILICGTIMIPPALSFFFRRPLLLITRKIRVAAS